MPTLLRSQSISCNPLWLRNRRKELKTFKGKARKDAYLLARKFRNTRDQMALMQVWGVGGGSRRRAKDAYACVQVPQHPGPDGSDAGTGRGEAGGRGGKEGGGVGWGTGEGALISPMAQMRDALRHNGSDAGREGA